MLTYDSDAPTPAEQTKQILAVAPILSGQHGNEKNPIPPFHPQSVAGQPAAVAAAPAQQPPVTTGDLIDFGQSSTPARTAAAIDIEQTLRSTSTSQPGSNQGPLLNFHEDLQSNIPAVDQKLKRQDTETQSVDEFLDAEG